MHTAGWDPVRGQWILVPYGYPVRQPPRPTYREPHPVRPPGVWAGIGGTVVWFLFFALLAWNVRSYAWATIIAGLVAWGVAAALNRYGDRGVALGVAVTSACCVSIAGLVVGVLWFMAGEWILW